MAPEIESLATKEVKKPKKYALPGQLASLRSGQASWKFWVSFWVVSGILLFGWYIFLQIQNKNIQNLKPFAKILPISSERKNELQVLTDIYEKMGGFNKEKTFLILFQNDMELRPGGGFIGSFGIVKTKAGKISDFQMHDTGNFDGRIPDTETPPYPMGEMLYIKSWKLRDSNWSPDFQANAKKAEYFYKLGEGQENFDGVIAVNTDVLNSILGITGPVKINDYPGEYNDQTAILQLEYQVEKGFVEQGIEKGERKEIMKELAAVLIEKVHGFTIGEQLELAKKIEDHLKRKDIQFFFKDEDLQAEVESMGWGGRVREYSGDYLMAVDANLNSLKSDVCIRRKMEYSVDLATDVPQANLKISYDHTCRTIDWMTANYNDWLRVYVPAGSFLTDSSNAASDALFSEDLGKKVFAMKVFVPVGQSKTVELKYNLPERAKNGVYSLLVQKQSGVTELPVKISIKKADGSLEEKEEVLKEDKVFSF
ncbi:MAG: hypothetical protein A3J76_00630 [Candidatus Moranbacteria bacterium RBG_13_45_13]|nr:MAG: hypothetical protein A3J76_00630 [Candidatus Moranbacteria bacterium RBG_13_45_13]